MKICKKCRAEKPLKHFYSNGLKRSGGKKHKPNCKVCEQKIRIKKHWKKIEIILGSVCCSKCGYDKNLSALEFHHIDSDSKIFEPSDSKSFSIEKLRKEMSKCVLLCANCHREEHHKHMERVLILPWI